LPAKRALVVDDDPQVLSLVGRWLTAAGYDVVMADNFNDATIEIQMRPPEIVVTDIRLGDFNGIQLGFLSRDVRPDARLVIISGWNDSVLRRDAVELGATFIQKPLRAAELLSAIECEIVPPPLPGTPRINSM
jgi:DNA-binding response OmpR family regulator